MTADIEQVLIPQSRLDYNDYYRNLPDIVTLRRGVIANGRT